MPVEIEQQRGDICEFQRCSQLSVVKLYLNMVNLRKNMFLVLRIKKEVVLFPEIGLVKIFSSFTCPHSRMCIRIYIFLFQRKKTHKQKAKETKENRNTKETKEEKD